jgi:hypothetical protein
VPVRAYLSPWQSFTDAEGFTEYWAKIFAPGSYIASNGLTARAIDLRTAEQQLQIPAQGWALVLTNVTPPQHNQIMQDTDIHEVNAGTTVAEVRAIIGDEATDDALDGSNLDQLVTYFQSVHKGRINRWKGRV